MWTNKSGAGQLDGPTGRVHVVGHGDTFTAAGFDVHVHGELHAEIHPEIPRVSNVGFLVICLVFHPGDALTVPEEPVARFIHSPPLPASACQNAAAAAWPIFAASE